MLRSVMAALSLAMLLPVSVAAQDFGMMNSAETINRGNFKLMANPLVVFGKDGEDDEVGLALAGGYGFTDRVDAEAKVSFFDDLTFIGGDVEVWVVKDAPIDVSVIGGSTSGSPTNSTTRRGSISRFLGAATSPHASSFTAGSTSPQTASRMPTTSRPFISSRASSTPSVRTSTSSPR